jgi:hypothetical protein
MKSFREIALTESKAVMLYKGGCDAPLIDGMQPANCGAQFMINNVVYEAMSSKYSSHPTNIVSLYLKNDFKKVEISIWLLEDDDYENAQFGIAYYPDFKSNHSSKYTQKLSAKWAKYKNQLIAAHKSIFNGNKGD